MRRSVRREVGHGGEAVWDRPGQRRVRRGERLTVWSFFFYDVRAGPSRSGTSHRKQSDRGDSIEGYRSARKPSESDAGA